MKLRWARISLTGLVNGDWLALQPYQYASNLPQPRPLKKCHNLGAPLSTHHLLPFVASVP
jgi:hypothetical protein